VLLSSGLIAGGAIGGLLVAGGRVALGGEERLGVGAHSWITSGEWSNIIGLAIFACLGVFLYTVARRKSET
jgi:hypothetical protein